MGIEKREIYINSELDAHEMRTYSGLEEEVIGCPDCGHNIAEDIGNSKLECVRCGESYHKDEFMNLKE